MARDFQPMIVGRGDHRVHFVERHAQRVMVVDLG